MEINQSPETTQHFTINAEALQSQKQKETKGKAHIHDTIVIHSASDRNDHSGH